MRFDNHSPRPDFFLGGLWLAARAGASNDGRRGEQHGSRSGGRRRVFTVQTTARDVDCLAAFHGFQVHAQPVEEDIEADGPNREPASLIDLVISSLFILWAEDRLP